MTEIARKKLACAFYFIVPALSFGMLSSRLPAFREILALSNSEVGSLLLALGGATLLGLLCAAWPIEKIGAKKVAAFSAASLMIMLICASFAQSFWQMFLFLALTGLSVGFCDVGMNALGIHLEQKHNIHCLAFLHACSSLGAVAGALTGYAFALLPLPPFWNFLSVLGIFIIILPFIFPQTPETAISPQGLEIKFFHNISLFLVLCGIMSLVCHIVEGSSGEWGSILLVSVKGASQSLGALVFAFFTGGTVIIRLLTDDLRYRISDFHLTLIGSLTGFLAMSLVLLSPWPWLCLAGYFLLGLSLGPITPVLFSRAGSQSGVSPGEASAIVSIFSYAGLLLFPPFFGMLGEAWGLVGSLWLIAFFCLCMAAGSVFLKSSR